MSRLIRIARRPFVVMPLVAVLILGVMASLRLRPDSESQTTQALEQVVAATRGTIAQTVSAEGTVAALATEDLSFSSSGTVATVNVKAGDVVSTGDVLATIDSAELLATVADAKAALAEAEAKLADDSDADASDAQIAADETALTTAKDRLTSSVEALGGSQLVAGQDGTVTLVDLTVGEELASGGTGGTSRTGSASGTGSTSGTLGSASGGAGIGPGSTTGTSTGSSSTPQIQLTSSGSYLVQLGFDSTDIAKLAVGQTANVKLSSATASTSRERGFSGMQSQRSQASGSGMASGNGTASSSGTESATSSGSASGLVTEIGKVADASSGVASYPVTVVFNDTSGSFNVGATVTVEISYDQIDDAITVPVRAVSTEGSTSTVTVRPSGADNSAKDEKRSVTTGLSANGMVQIVSGLDAGESVVITFARPVSPTGQGDDSDAGTQSQMGGPGEGFTPPQGFDPGQFGQPPQTEGQGQ